ncbi:DRTGG domain-containing protein [Clostridium sp. KNHs216]|uniref:DRTGG domain-containing protein n=1 Tax=Clostridium sp. KNHs216 TaxID=1550235 RepID=UPI001150D1FD|nr:DRTGG domain-containing protein [Clostridium sp. KNHs216]TQI67140.1 DRTGG domain-containing protein [Clostridium sp. KNHs216]
MTVQELAEKLSLKILAGRESLDREVTGGYTGDLLSWVMSRLPENAAWLTVMGNINAVAVASLKDAACIVLTDSAPFDEEALEKARQLDFPVLLSEQNSYELGLKVAELLR